MKAIKWILIIWSALTIITIPTEQMHPLEAFFAFVYLCLVIISCGIDLAKMNEQTVQKKINEEK